MGELSNYHIGQHVELSDGRAAIVQFIGNTHFAAGDWVGVELENGSGKNDGEVQGQRYFDCPENHGMFVRPAAITILDHPTLQPSHRVNGNINGATPKPRPSSMTVGGSKRQSVLDPVASKRQSINAASPTPPSRVSRLASPSKSPTKQFGSTTSSGTSTRTGTPSNQVRKSIAPSGKNNYTSMGPPPPISSPARASRPSIAGTLNGPSKPSSQASSLSREISGRVSLRPGARDRIESTSGDSRGNSSSGHQSPNESPRPHAISPSLGDQGQQVVSLISPTSQVANASHAPPEKPVLSRGRSPALASQRGSTHTAASAKEVEDLKTKLRLIEKKRLEDREKLRAMDKVQADKDKFEGIILKLQAKYQPQQQELADLKRQVREEEEERIQKLERQLAENESVMEVATLDREMAEETAESMKLELETLRQKYEEIELEATVLREENEELGKEISPEDKTSQGWIHLERSNERLREALMRLRDVTQEQESNLKDQIAELETDVQDLAKTKEESAFMREGLDQSNATIDNLRQQLDTALGAEDMIEELTEKNMALSERMEEMKMTIEDLESLKELNDELEINHTETEKQLQAEVDYHELLLSEEARKTAVQDGTIQDLEYTVSRFRDLVTNMQNDLEDLRASQQITESEANELTTRSRAMMDLNMRLQTSAAKAQFKAVDLELGKMQAQESSEHLAIVQHFLPDTFKSEQDSIHAILRFRRISFKARMMHSFIRENVNGSTSALNEDDISASSDVLEKLTWVYSTCDRFISHIQTCDLTTFKRLGGASYELEPVERAFNAWIDHLKRNELKAEQCAIELQRSIALMGHLAEIHINDDLEHYPDKVLTHALLMQSHLENAAIIFANLKTRLESIMLEPEADDTENEGYYEMFSKIDTLISSSRSAKVVSSKAIRQLEDLKARSLTLDLSTWNVVERAQESTSDLLSSIRSFCTSVLGSLSNYAQETDPDRSNITHVLISGSMNISILTTKLHLNAMCLQTFYSLTNTLTQTVELPSPPPPPPWKLLAQKLRDETADIAAREMEFSRLKDEVSEKNTTLAIKDKMLEELSVKSEVLEKRVGEFGGRKERVRDLENAAEAYKAKEKDYVAKLTQLRKEVEKLEGERETWRKASQPQPSVYQAGEVSVGAAEAVTSVATLQQIDDLKAEIAALQSSIRYLRSAHHRSFISNSETYLSAPLTPPTPSSHPIETEAKDALREMLHLISKPTSQPVKLQRRRQEDRFRWRPAKDTSSWQVQRQREEWEEWREWRDSVAQRSWEETREQGRRREVKSKGKVLANLEMGMTGKHGGGVVEVAQPGEWGQVI